jgi:hypothetical protein
VEDNLPPALSSPATNTNSEPTKLVRVSYLTEQTSHHPPVSAFYVDCPEKGISARGFDQISAKFTGTSIRVTPGAHNLGIFITLHARENEQYQLTHPAAYLGGLLRGISAPAYSVEVDSADSKLGTLSVTVSDVCYISCPKTKTKVILHYVEESWLGKSQHRVDGVVFKYDPENDNKSKIKDVPDADILARIEGSWMDKIFVILPCSTVRAFFYTMKNCANSGIRKNCSWSTLTRFSRWPRLSPQKKISSQTRAENFGLKSPKQSMLAISAEQRS